MDKKIILLGSLFLASNLAMAETSLLESAGKQLIKDKATAVAPDAVKQAEGASQVLDAAKAAKAQAAVPVATPAPDAAAAVQDAAKTAVEKKATEATPAAATKALDAVESGKAAVESAPTAPGEAIEAVKSKATEKATEKAFDLLK